MRADPAEFRKLDLRCHALLAGVPLHDVWTMTLTGGGPDRTMHDVIAISPLRGRGRRSVAVRALFAMRGTLGRLFRWDEPRHDRPAESYLHRLGDDDRARSLVAPGTREGAFRVLVLFPAEMVLELRNATVHAFMAFALTRQPDGYRLYWAIYVKPVSRFTTLYMRLIDPFRRAIVYPASIRRMEAAWSTAYA